VVPADRREVRTIGKDDAGETSIGEVMGDIDTLKA
jgi:hypothetical protein